VAGARTGCSLHSECAIGKRIMSEGSHELTPLQRDLLRAFFEREQGFFLTGGAALVGYYLHHRQTTDLDLFATSDLAYERGRHALSGAAAALGATLEVRQDTPDFKRFAVARGDELVVVDLVRDRVAQLRPEKPVLDGVRVDPIEEIVANKLTTVVGRMEERDLVDLYLLEREGHVLEAFLDAALAKDGGCTPATLAWLLSEVQIGDDAELPGGIEPRALRDWMAALVVRLRRAAAPKR
jgi:predicted nucleotidyltransferase component of viral defense system